jgi:microcystin degradation protein MlrC
MRIAIGGIMHESNTFAAKPTDAELFRAGGTTYGAALLPVWADAHHEMGGFIEGAERYHYEAIPTAMGWATPAGPVTDEFFDHFVDTIITNAKLGKPDGILLALHGAMVTPKHPDADAEVCRRVRSAMGPDMPIAVSLDFHGNPTPNMAETVNIIVAYQTYPHIDQRARGLLAAELITRAIKKEIRPVTYVAKPPLIINLLGQATDREPMKGLMRLARTLEHQPGMLSVSVMAGFPYADVPWMGPSVLAVADGDAAKAKQIAEQVAAEMWEMRHELYVPCPQPEEAVNQAVAADRCPVILVDLGDNVGGGSAADGTVLLAELLNQKARGFVVPLYAPEGVEAAKKAGIDGVLEITVGGAADKLHGDPVRVKGTVRSLHTGTWVEVEARHGGRRLNDQGHTAVIDLGDNNLLVLNTLRTPPFSLGQLTSLGIEPRLMKAIVVKAAVAYKAAYAPIAGTIIEVDTPGITAINPARFTYQKIRRPMYPLT